MPLVLGLAGLIFLAWTILGVDTGDPAEALTGVLSALLVGVIGYPCAIGSSTPIVGLSAFTEYADRGILLFGMAACYATTFASAAAPEDVGLTKLTVRAENDLDLREQVGLSRDSIIQRVKFTVEAAGAPRDLLARLKTLADERCPGVECLTRSIPLETILA